MTTVSAPVFVEARQRRDLVAQRLAGAGRQDGEQVFAAQRRFDDALLQRRPSAPAGCGRKAVKPNQRRSSRRASWCSLHQAASRVVRRPGRAGAGSALPAPGN
jgi:hypothetical protein